MAEVESAAVAMATASTAPRNKEQSFIPHDDDRSSLNSYDSVQAGVKNIEAISQTWTRWSLVSAYLGYVSRFLFGLAGFCAQLCHRAANCYDIIVKRME